MSHFHPSTQDHPNAPLFKQAVRAILYVSCVALQYQQYVAFFKQAVRAILYVAGVVL